MYISTHKKMYHNFDININKMIKLDYLSCPAANKHQLLH